MARDFDDTDVQRIECGTWFPPTGDKLSISFWSQVDDFSPSDFRWISKEAGTGDHNWMVSNNSTETIVPRLRIHAGATPDTTTLVGADTTLSDANWHHYVCTYDGALGSNHMKIYFDGSLNAQGSHAQAGDLKDDSYQLWIGANATGGYGPVDGRMAEAAVWSYALSAGEIAAIANGSPLGRFHRDKLEAYYPLDGVDANTEFDYSGHERHGTLNGTTGKPTAADHCPCAPRVWFGGWQGIAVAVGGDQAVTTNLASVTAQGFDASAAGTGSAPVTLSLASAVAAAFQAAGIGTGSAPLTANLASAVAAAFQTAGVGSGSAPLTASLSSVTATAFSATGVGTGSAPVTTNLATAIAQAFQAAITGTGSAPVTANLASVDAVAFDVVAALGSGPQVVTTNLATVTVTGLQAAAAGTGTATVTLNLATAQAIAQAVTALTAGTFVDGLDVVVRIPGQRRVPLLVPGTRKNTLRIPRSLQ